MLRACLLSLALSFTIVPISAQIAATASTPTEPAAAAAPFVKPAPPGELVDIGGSRRLHISCKGDADGPTVIFEAGLSQYTATSTFGKAQDLIALFARTCVYDRAGLGWSDATTSPHTQLDMVEDLHNLVAAKQLTGPLVLVGHSMGGLLARRYAKQYPGDVVGMVLVDATPTTYLYGPGAAEARQEIIGKIAQGLKAAKPGVPVVPMPADTDANIVIAFLPEVLETVMHDYQAIDRVPEALRSAKGYGTLGDMPLVVIRRGDPATPPSEEDLQWREMQASMASLSTRSELVVAEGAGHVIPYEAPQVVADAVERVLSQIK